jgi:hypothetical protein
LKSFLKSFLNKKIYWFLNKFFYLKVCFKIFFFFLNQFFGFFCHSWRREE